MADVDAVLMRQVFDVSQAKRKPDKHHHRQADDFGTAMEVLLRDFFRHAPKLRNRPARLNRIPSDTAVHIVVIRRSIAEIIVLANAL